MTAAATSGPAHIAASLVDASDEAVAAIPEDTLAGEQINSRSDHRAPDYFWP